jgi:uncharacterized membrane protein
MPHTYQPFAENDGLTDLSKRLSRNISEHERTISIFAGITLAGLGVARRSWSGALALIAGAALIHRGVTGRCSVYRALGIPFRAQDQAGVPGNRGHKIVRVITVARPRAEVFSFWRKLDNLPQFMPHLEKVELLDHFRSRWVVRTVTGATVEWQAEIINERENEMLAWQSLPGAQVPNAGSVRFEDAAPSGTRVKVALEYDPPAGVIGDAVAAIFGGSPEWQLEKDLQHWKEIMEAPSSAAASTPAAPLATS